MNFKIIYILVLLFSYIDSLQAQSEQNVSDTINYTDARGQKQGIWRENFGTGLLKRETLYKDGKKNGLELIFFQWPNCLKEESEYSQDTLLRRTTYHRNCNVKMVESFRHGQREGYTKIYNRNGYLEKEGMYKNGKLQGTIKHYDKNGIAAQENNLIVPSINLEGFLTGDIPILDSTVFKALSKIKLTKNTLIATDVTGSMHANAGQLLLWYNLNMTKNPVQHFVFFNDGDNMPDYKKKTGKTGGIYTLQPDDMLALKNTMELAITKGSGGDMPENDLEAILAGISKFRKTDQVILIADRRSAVKDISLLKKIKVPVNIILCGPENFTHVHYLQIAYKTGGGLYSLTDELKDIKGIQNGQKLQIANLIFTFKDGQFRRVRN